VEQLRQTHVFADDAPAIGHAFVDAELVLGAGCGEVVEDCRSPHRRGFALGVDAQADRGVGVERLRVGRTRRGRYGFASRERDERGPG
jgi:hypothetical protein